MNVNAAKFCATLQIGKYLVGVQKVLRVECAFQTHLLIKINLIEHQRHQIPFFNTHAMLAGQHAANIYT